MNFTVYHWHNERAEDPHQMLQYLIDHHYDVYDVESLPLPIGFVIKKGLESCRMNPRSDWDQNAYYLIDREDLAIQFFGEKPINMKKRDLEMDMNAWYLKDAELNDNPSRHVDPLENSTIKSRFPHDHRIKEVSNMLNSTKSCKIKVPPTPEGADEQVEQQNHLVTIAGRTLSLPVGRGMLHLGLGTPLVESNYNVPNLQLGAQFIPFKTVVPLQMAPLLPDFSKWGEFHNGVAVENKIKAVILRQPPYENIPEEDRNNLLTELKATKTDLKAKEKYWQDLILAIAKGDQELESKSFGEADAEWISSITGINTQRRRWDIVFDESVEPSEAFKDQFIRICFPFGEGSWTSDELEMSIIKLVGNKRRKLGGKHDYTVGFGKDLAFGEKTTPKELHLVAIEAKRKWGQENIWKCVAEAATLYRSRKDAGKEKCSVWGILANAKNWMFIYIDEDGLLWRSDEFIINLPDYRENEVLLIYRIMYDIVKKSFDACTPTGSEE
jgi:hypothetical protein